MTQTFADFINYYAPALMQIGGMLLVLGFLFFVAILGITLIKWAWRLARQDKYGRDKYN